MKIVILDGYAVNPGDLSWDFLNAFGDVFVYERTPANQAIERSLGADILLTNKTPITEELLNACPTVKLICVLATGYNIVDCVAAKARNIPVCNVPAYSTHSVAQMTFALLLELCNRVGHHSDAVHSGAWCRSQDFCFWDYPQMELAGKTMGIVGFGQIGRAVGMIAKAMGMRVLAFNRSRCAEGEAIGEYVDLDTLLAKSDVISLHCPLTELTTGIINAASLAKAKNSAILINTARGPLVDEQAVANALRSGKLRGFAADVISAEPMLDSNPLLGAPNCILTPHIAWAPLEARKRIQDCTCRNIKGFLAGNPINVVNP